MNVEGEVMRRMTRARAVAALIVGVLLATVVVAPATAYAKRAPTTTVYRFYNQGTGAHFYTASVAERDIVFATWPTIYTYEGTAFYLYDWYLEEDVVDTAGVSPVDPTTPVYRFYNVRNGSHFYTMSSAEAEMVMSAYPTTFTYDGIAFAAYTGPSDDLPLMPVYRFYHKYNGSHFYTISPEEKALVQLYCADTYRFEGVAFYALSAYKSFN